jgi:hypothetical protein
MKKRDPTVDEITEVVKACAHDDVVLIGGIAVSLLASVYKVQTIEPIYTSDGDFFGDHLALTKSKAALPWNSREYVATMDESTPNVGKLAVDVAEDAKPVEVDFLSSVNNLSSDEIEQRAIKLQIGDKIVRVLHPILVLESKIGNLALYPNKRNQGGVGQAKAAVAIAKAYLSGIQTEREREQLNGMERVGRFAAREGACYVHKIFGVDALGALPDQPISRAFIDRRLPQIREQVTGRRQAFDSLWDRTAQFRDPKKERYRP